MMNRILFGDPRVGLAVMGSVMHTGHPVDAQRLEDLLPVSDG